MIPETVQAEILNYCQRNAGAKVSIHKEGNPYILYGLSFDINGKALLTSGNVNIISYIDNHLTYSRVPIEIKIDDKSLKEFKLVALPPTYPETINLSETEQ